MGKYTFTKKRVFKNGREIEVFVPTSRPDRSMNPVCTKRVFAGASIGSFLLTMGLIALSYC